MRFEVGNVQLARNQSMWLTNNTFGRLLVLSDFTWMMGIDLCPLARHQVTWVLLHPSSLDHSVKSQVLGIHFDLVSNRG